MLKLYTDINLLNEKNRTYLFPLLFDLHFSRSNFYSQYYNLEDNIEEADIAILPLEYGFMLKNYNKYVDLFFKKAKNFNKPIWIYSGGDYGISIEEKGVYNFRLGGFKSKLNNNTIIIPSFITDPYSIHIKDGFKPKKKEKQPKIGFVGHAKEGIIKYFKEYFIYLRININRLLKLEYADYQPFYPSSLKRAHLLKLLEKYDQITTDFIFRDRYRAGVIKEEEKADTTKEFYQNIFDNPYTFNMRGGGNFSVRFYETLAVGRIPVLLNTDCLLPLSNNINWNEHCLIIDEADYKSVGKKVLDFHSNLNEDEFISIQKNNRTLWEKYLTRHTFFPLVHDLFLNKVKSK